MGIVPGGGGGGGEQIFHWWGRLTPFSPVGKTLERASILLAFYPLFIVYNKKNDSEKHEQHCWRERVLPSMPGQFFHSCYIYWSVTYH